MNKIKFTPVEFHKVELSNYKINTDENECTPGYPDCRGNSLTNQVKIKSPKQIIYYIDNVEEISQTEFILPICLYYHLTERRSLKYFHLQKEVHIKNVDDANWYTGEVKDRAEGREYQYQKTQEQELKIAQMVAEAQNYSDDELNSSGWLQAMNFNLFNFVYYPSLTSGRYEIYFSFRGMESNHCFVDIIIETTKKLEPK